MLSKVLSFALIGLEGYCIEVDTDLTNGFMRTDIVGMGDTAVKEAKDRIMSAIENSGFSYPMYKTVISLAPADIKKEGASFDLAMAVGILSADGKYKGVSDTVYLGELSLSGEIRPVSGILPLLISAKEHGYKKFVIPRQNAEEASYVEGIEVFPAKTLLDVVHKNIEPLVMSKYSAVESSATEHDFKYVKGQTLAKRALEIAVSGGHNIIMIGSPGSGKTMLAKCIPSIMPPMEFSEALEVTKIHSISRILKGGIISVRPFRSPHHTATSVALVGGGNKLRPGEFSLAHSGVLFLDELPEYSRHALETMRQPLEDGTITISRANGKVTYPSNFMLVASMNPCPCGNYGSKKKVCKCTKREISKYIGKISSPLLDRIDLHVEVDCVEYDDIVSSGFEESSSDIRKRVVEARKRQLNRQGKCNDGLQSREISEYCKLDDDCSYILEQAFEKLKLSARAYSRILKVARTIADIKGCENIEKSHVVEAVQYRALDRKYFE